MNVRRGNPTDHPAVRELQTGPASREHLERELKAGVLLVCTDGDEVIGFAIWNRSFFGKAFLALLFVGPAHRRRGAGRALLRLALSASSSDKFFTTTNQSNAPMQRLLKSEGFVPSGVIHNLDPGDPELVFFRAQDGTA